MLYQYQPSQQSFQDYLMSETDDGQRLAAQHDAFKPTIMEMFQLVLEEYGLLHKLEQTKEASKQGANATSKVAILDLGCGEGVFTFDLAGILKKHKVIDRVQLFGIDIDATAIGTANELCKNFNSSRPYISFKTGDITLPFANEEPSPENPSQTYDFIFAISVMVHLTDSRKQLQRVYQHLLKPGGIIFLADTVLTFSDTDEVDGSVLPHPIMSTYFKEVHRFVHSKNPGVEVATAQVQWLEELGAERVMTTKNRLIIGGDTVEGIAMLRNLVMAMRSGAPFLISHGLITKAFHDEIMTKLFKELSVDSQGHLTLVNVIATKPNNS
jgi:SAM-dependent methyltransferase